MQAGDISPESGTLQGNTYYNSFLRFSYQFPFGWNAYGGDANKPALPSGQATEAHAYRLFLATEGAASENSSLVMVSAQPLTSKELKRVVRGEDYLNAVRPRLVEAGLQSMGKPEEMAFGPQLYREDYRSQDKDGPRFLTVVATVIRNYVVNFLFQAPSAEKLQAMVRTLDSLEFQPDWASNEQENAAGVVRVRVSERILNGLAVKRSAPVYPEKAKKSSIEGPVVFSILVGQDGSVQCLWLRQGEAVLANAAMPALEQWRFLPYTVRGTAVQVESQLTVAFRMSP